MTSLKHDTSHKDDNSGSESIALTTFKREQKHTMSSHSFDDLEGFEPGSESSTASARLLERDGSQLQQENDENHNSRSDEYQNQEYHNQQFSHNFSHSSTALGRIKGFFSRVWEGPLHPEDKPPPQIKSLKALEELPEKLKQRIPRQFRIAAVVCYLLFWFGLCYSILVPYLTIPSALTNDPDVTVLSLSCQAQSSFWRGRNGACGLDGKNCPSEKLGSEIVFRCPALCDRGSWTYSLIPVGDQRIKYRGYFVGGGDQVVEKIHPDQVSNPYRADSYPCGAAIHAGLISPFFGGCARISYDSEERSYFASTVGHYGVGKSIEFLSFFKSSYFFKDLLSGVDGNGSFTHCYDPRLLVLLVNIILGIPVVYLASGAVLYWIISVVGFWTICMATDPPITVDATNSEDFAELISIGLEQFLPACCILYVLWHCSAKRTLSDHPTELDIKKSPLSRLFYWYPLFWLGVLNNMTFDRLPVDRLTWSDLKEQSGAFLAVGSIIGTIAICAVIQAYKIWLSGRFRKYLLVYGSFIFGLFVVHTLPGLTLRIHHYILAMLLIPGCATRGRTALLFQGILLGLFLSGVARWGLAAIAETVTSLKRDDPRGKVVPPEILAYNSTAGILSWTGIKEEILTPLQAKIYEKYSQISVLVNDIERYIGDSVESVDLKTLFDTSADLKKEIADSLKNGYRDDEGNIMIYIRVGRKIPDTNSYSDYTNAAVLKWPSGELALPVSGLT